MRQYVRLKARDVDHLVLILEEDYLSKLCWTWEERPEGFEILVQELPSADDSTKE